MRIVVALGGNALLRRGEPLTAENQRERVRNAARALAPLAAQHELVISHGNGPQVGLLALQGAAYKPDELYPLDVLGAQTEGMIGYLVEQELRNLLPSGKSVVSVLTMVEVDAADKAFENPTKFIGPVYDASQARQLGEKRHWAMARDGQSWRRVVPSPQPRRIVEIEPVRWLLNKQCVVICAGGGGIPTIVDECGQRYGTEAVIDKDLTSELLAREVDAELFVMATDVDAVYVNWGTAAARPLRATTPEELSQYRFPMGSMGPKVDAACRFADHAGKIAAIGSLDDLGEIVAGRTGTTVVAQPAVSKPGSI